MASLSQTKNRFKIANLLTSAKVGFFLAVRQIRRTSLWTNILVVCIMTLTFLNLVVVSGILVGLIEGAVEAIKTHFLGDVFISNLKDRPYIEQSQKIISFAENLPGVEAISARYIESGTVQSEYKTNRKPNELPKEVGVNFSGIDPENEDKVTSLSKLVVEGEYLEKDDYDKVLVGSMLLKKYLDFEAPSFPVLENVSIGDKIKININGNSREVVVKGITKSKVDEIDRRVFFIDKQLQGLINRYDYNADEIVVKLSPQTSSEAVKTALLDQGFGNFAKIQTPDDAEPKFIKDMKKTFDTLGNVISSIGLVVATITIFIVIFINAVTRRKYIGIMKGIGISSLAIEIAYVFQSFFYAVLGIIFGTLLVFGFLEPYLRAHPIDFPFSDGILVVSITGTAIRSLILIVATLVAGYIPAKLITRQNTVDAILNR